MTATTLRRRSSAKRNDTLDALDDEVHGKDNMELMSLDKPPDYGTVVPKGPVGNLLDDGYAKLGGDEDLVYHIYKGPGVFNDDMIVADHDKTTPLYFLRVPFKLGHGWEKATMSAGGRDGPLVARLRKPMFLGRSDISIDYYPRHVSRHDPILSDDHRVLAIALDVDGWFTDSHVFCLPEELDNGTGLGGKRLKWWSGWHEFRITLMIEGTQQEVARYEWIMFSWKKSGTIQIKAEYEPLKEVLLLTGAAMVAHKQQRRRERSNKGGGGGP